MDNEQQRVGVIFTEAAYRGLKVTLYPTPGPDGEFEFYEEDGRLRSRNVEALFDYADVMADELSKRAPETSKLVQEARRRGAEDAPPMGRREPQRVAADSEECTECGGPTKWSAWKTIRGKQKRALECDNGCKNDRGYALTVRWQEGR